MDWKGFWNRQAGKGSLMQQVARTGHHEEKMERLMAEQAAFIAGKAGLTSSASLLDVCCGNGAFSRYLAAHAGSFTGIDFSEKLIGEARLHYPELHFGVADALNLSAWDRFDELREQFDVITLCFSFQYFETVAQGMTVIRNLIHLLKPGGRIMLTDVPDRARFFSHYHSPARIAGLVVQMARGRNVMGKFWGTDELAYICAELGVKGEKVEQPGHFPYAHYRMDYLIHKA